MIDADAWAAEEFGGADLGDARRTERLVRLAAEVAQRPAGTVTGVCKSLAAREGAFRWLENQAVRVDAVEAARVWATSRRCRGIRRIHVPIDGTALTLTDNKRSKDFGGIGSWKNGARGVQVMTALALGGPTPVGILGQRMWVRESRSTRREKAPSDEVAKRETHHWIELLRNVHERLREEAPDTEAFFQLDRGADCWPVLTVTAELGLLLTVRAAHDRRVDTPAHRLWAEVERAPKRDVFRLAVPERPVMRRRQRIRGRRIQWTVRRKARVAELVVRAAPVPILLSNGHLVTFNAVLVRERHRREDDRIEWLLLSSHPIEKRADVRAIVDGYALRWRIEDFHKTWKRGLCRVEDTQLRSRQAVFKWATILASVASRAMHLTHQARKTPDAPATDEFSRNEIDAIIALRQPKGVKLGDTPSLGEVVRWIADWGGYMGPWNGPPGPKVIGRGLEDVLAAAKALTNIQKMR